MTAAPFSSNHSSWPDGRFPCLLLLYYLLTSVITVTLATFYRTSHNLTVHNLTLHGTPHTISLYRTSHNLTVHNLTLHGIPHTISLYRTSHNLTVHNLTQSHSQIFYQKKTTTTKWRHDSSLHSRSFNYLTAHLLSRHGNRRLVHKNIAFCITHRNIQSGIFTNAYSKYKKGKVFPVHATNAYGGVEV